MARVGDDWFADMMRLPKPMLIDFLRRANLRARNAEAALSAATNKPMLPCKNAKRSHHSCSVIDAVCDPSKPCLIARQQ